MIVYFLMLVAFGLSGCAEDLSVMHETKVDLESDLTIIGSGALPIVKNVDGTYCFGPQPDSSISLDLSAQSGTSPLSSVTDNDNESSLGGRNPNVLITRDLLFQSCLAESRLKLSKKERKELFEKTLSVIQAINGRSVEGSSVVSDNDNSSDE